jgi:hypothetical protein
MRWIRPLQSSNPYSFRPVNSKKTGTLASWLIAAGALGAGVVFGVLPNGGFEALLPKVEPTPTPSETGATTATGEPIVYPYGTVQVSVTRENGKLTAVDMVQSEADNGREQAFPLLQQAALDANGSSFGNVGGATYTSDAFKLALDSAIAGLP